MMSAKGTPLSASLGGGGSPKSRRKEHNLLVCDSDKQSLAFKFRFVFFSFKSCVISAVCRPIWLKFDTRLT